MKYELMALVGNGKWIDTLSQSNNISWSSDKDTLGIELSFDTLINLVEGTHIILKIDSKVSFTGILVKKNKKKLSYSYTCFDYAWYLNKNTESIIQFNKVTADVAINQLCSKFGVKCNCVKIKYIVQDTAETTVTGTTSTNATTSGNSIVDVAKKYLGVKYVWGGTTPSGFDCSGFVQYVFGQVKVNISRTTYTQIKEGTSIAKSNLQAGDIVFFGSNASNPTHEALYIGGGNVIQSPHTGDVVKITPLSAMSNYITARRIKIPNVVTSASTNSVATTSGTVTATKSTESTTISTKISKVYRNQTLSAIIDDILNNATLELGTKYIKEMISDILYIRVLREYKIFPTFLLQNDVVVSSSIENMVNKVVVLSSDDANKNILTTVSDAKNITTYGGLQAVLAVEKADESHAKFIADKYLLANNKIFKSTTLNIVVLSGGEEIRSNRVIGLNITSMRINGWYSVKSTSCQLVNNQLKASITIEW
ncbi:C40 family peptidase [Clostridium estertheticum]|uniref:C40 family peptidase n=1 Tax=Clostridium estertheticum TaxID=238834 RepID=UPI001C6F3150|nr:C40 family peptidase [Clostridium estertheticum]MBW9170783.1 C40 family peptidase [Clostridium estertheticum]WLC74378.1 C40 family peptidase [Clostridium estertheticum]